MSDPNEGGNTVGRVPESRRGIKAHRRFALREVTLGGVPVGNATIDVWRDESGAERWSARLLLPIKHPLREGILSGLATGGQRIHGMVHLGESNAGPRRGREMLVEFHGDGLLGHGDDVGPPPRRIRPRAKG